jgi:HAD superfamily hydrolase (TIGR01509 family)
MAIEVKALFWDNDGVLVDTEHLYFEATRAVLRQVGVELDEPTYVELLLRQSRGAWHLAEERGVASAAIARLREERDALYERLIAEEPRLIPGVEAALARLATRFRMAIVTSSKTRHFACIHRSTGILPWFEFVLTREDYAESKPDPEPYLLALARSGLRADECLVIEDSERGLVAAKAAGLRCWVVPSRLSRACSFAGADRVLESVEQVADALLGAQSSQRA